MLRLLRVDVVSWIADHALHILTGCLFAFASYFFDIIGEIAVVSAAIILDMFFGVWASRCKGEGIVSRKLWRTIYKWAFVTVLIMLLYAASKELGDIGLYKGAAWIVVGIEAWSIAESMGYICKSKLFEAIRRVTRNKVEKTTGMDIKELMRDEESK